MATLAVKKVADTREYGVVLHDRAGRITGFQEKPEPDEALSDLGNCGIYIFEPADLRLLPRPPVRGLGPGRVPGAAGATTCRSTSTRCASTGTTSARWRSCARAPSTRCAASCAWRSTARSRPRRDRRRRGSVRCPADAEVEGPGVDRRDVQIGAGRASDGPGRARRRRARRRRRAAAREHRLSRHRGRRRVDPDRRDRRARGHPAEPAPTAARRPPPSARTHSTCEASRAEPAAGRRAEPLVSQSERVSPSRRKEA